MSAVASTTGCLHYENVLLLFLEAHRETDRFLAESGVQFEHSERSTGEPEERNNEDLDRWEEGISRP